MVVHLTVVLLCQGRGADPSSYRPHRDESQWWNRRDALVRCVTAFLYGPSSSSSTRRELILLHDEDLATMQLTLSHDDDNDDDDIQDKNKNHKDSSSSSTPILLPTEQNILSIFKAAAKALSKQSLSPNINSAKNHNGVSIRQDGMTCRIRLPTLNTINKHSGRLIPSPSSSSSSSSMASKRDMLQWLQSECSMDFLRQHGLNCSAGVCLKKLNKEKLFNIRNQWFEQQQQPKKPPTKKNHHHHDSQNSQLLESILFDILLQQQYPKATTTRPCQRVAAVLHESSESELPCFESLSNDGWLDPTATTTTTTTKCTVKEEAEEKVQQDALHVFLFLGAVRDMHPWEEEALQRAWARSCRHMDADGAHYQRDHEPATNASTTVPPLLRIRLGPVPEFTSKILTVVAFHHATGRLEVGIRRMMTKNSHSDDDHMNSKKQKHDGFLEAPSTLSSSSSFKQQRRKRKRQLEEGEEQATTTSEKHHPKQMIPGQTVHNPWLHVVCFLPISCDQVSSALEDRSRVLWSLVRVTVCTLWRSRLASSSSSTNNTATTTSNYSSSPTLSSLDARNVLNNSLTLVLASSDGNDEDDQPLVLTVTAEEFVSSLAQQHQAAPTEHQILQVWRDRLQQQQQAAQKQRHRAVKKKSRKPRTSSSSAWATELISSLQATSSPRKTSVTGTTTPITMTALAIGDTNPHARHERPMSLSERYYIVNPVFQSRNHEQRSIHHLMVLLPISLLHTPSSATQIMKVPTTRPERESSDYWTLLVGACQAQDILVEHSSLVAPSATCQDHEAATVTLLQHLAYQHRLVGNACG
jgi:hypothetical protein